MPGLGKSGMVRMWSAISMMGSVLDCFEARGC